MNKLTRIAEIAAQNKASRARPLSQMADPDMRHVERE